MRFAHLAPRQAIGTIRRTGIRKGGGRRGRGVYAVPLFLLTVRSPKDPEDRESEYDESEAVSSSRLWRSFFKGGKGWRSQLIVIVFSAPASCWPVDLYIIMRHDVTPRFMAKLDESEIPGVTMTADNRRFVEESAAQGYSADLTLTIETEKALGKVLNCFLQSGGKGWSGADDSLEVVFRTPIPARSIEKTIPLYRTNDQFRRAKN